MVDRTTLEKVNFCLGNRLEIIASKPSIYVKEIWIIVTCNLWNFIDRSKTLVKIKVLRVCLLSKLDFSRGHVWVQLPRALSNPFSSLGRRLPLTSLNYRSLKAGMRSFCSLRAVPWHLEMMGMRSKSFQVDVPSWPVALNAMTRFRLHPGCGGKRSSGLCDWPPLVVAQAWFSDLVLIILNYQYPASKFFFWLRLTRTCLFIIKSCNWYSSNSMLF